MEIYDILFFKSYDVISTDNFTGEIKGEKIVTRDKNKSRTTRCVKCDTRIKLEGQFVFISYYEDDVLIRQCTYNLINNIRSK